jgi:NAD+ kinase
VDFLLVYSRAKPESFGLVERIERYVRESGHRVTRIAMEELGWERYGVDMAVAVGGDGTILRTFHHLEDPEVPVLPISFGRGGYLAEVGPEEAMRAVESVLSGSYYIERLMRLRVEVDGSHLSEGINDAYLSSTEPGKVIECSLSIDGLVLQGIVCDGLVFSTPAGSTAYNFSCGGPAVDDALESIAVAPVAPITYFRPLVVAATRTLEVELTGGKGTVLIDGYVRGSVNGSVRITRSPLGAYLIRVGRAPLFQMRLRKRLGQIVR